MQFEDAVILAKITKKLSQLIVKFKVYQKGSTFS